MFTHKIDPLVRKELDELASRLGDLETLVKSYSQGLKAFQDTVDAIEAKLDELLDKSPESSIADEKAKPEPLPHQPGHKPWSQRKKEREVAARSSTFVETVVKAAATTKPEASDGN